ncbi:MAG: CAP domain-containing protein, partial [Planctomycetota bacterium]
SYLEELEDAARAARKKVKVDRGKVKAARAVLAELRARGKRALYEVSIVSKGDPALATLRKELLLDVDTVVAGDGELATTRERLKVVHACQVSCEKVSGAAPAGAGKKRKKKSGKAVAPPATPGTADEALARKELLAVVIATLAGGGDGRVLEKNEKSSPAISGREADGILDLNILRILLGLKPLAIDVALCKAARDHANDMFEKDFCSHTSPVPGKETFELRAARFGTSARSENLGRGQETPQEATMGWFHSPGHHINMLETRWKIVGQGEAGKCWVLLFR